MGEHRPPVWRGFFFGQCWTERARKVEGSGLSAERQSGRTIHRLERESACTRSKTWAANGSNERKCPTRLIPLTSILLTGAKAKTAGAQVEGSILSDLC